MQEVEGSTPTGDTCPNNFSDPIDQDIHTHWALSWKIVVSKWRSVIAVSLNVGSGVRLIKPAKLCMCMQNTINTTRTDSRRRCVQQWFRTAEPLRECRYENWNTHTPQCHFVLWALSVNTSSQPIELSFKVILVHWLAGSIFTPLSVQVTLLCAGNQTPGREVLSLNIP